MAKAIKNNKILFIVTAIILICGACLAVLLINGIDAAQSDQQIETAEPEAAGFVPRSDSIMLSISESLQELVSSREIRRSTIIPVVGNVTVPEAKTWDKITSEHNNSKKEAAYKKSAQIAKELFGYEISSDYIFSYYTDTTEFRTDFVQIKTDDEVLVCTLAADDLDLINIDYYFFPKGEPRDLEQMTNFFPEEVRLMADKIAGIIHTKVSGIEYCGAGGSEEFTWTVYSASAEQGKFFKFAVSNGELAAVSVYPSKASMQEYVYFDADVQRDPHIVHIAYPSKFAEGEPGEGDMTKDEALNMYLTFLNDATGIESNDLPFEMRFYIDYSGKRENYWYIEGSKVKMEIASKNKWIIFLNCNSLWNTKYGLSEIEYIDTGVREYEEYVRNILNDLYGFDLAEVTKNASYDSNISTVDARMDDGTAYEFTFISGRLELIQYIFDGAYFGRAYGWKADNIYVNSITKEEFIPQY